MKLLSPSRFAAILLGLIGLLAVVGCNRSEGIQRYQQPKLHRTLAAVVVHDKQAWFFKVSGPNGELRDQLDDFRSLVKSVTFADPANPKWDLPAGWEQSSGAGMRFATIQIEVESEPDPIELTVIPLPVMGTEQEFLLANINRWRDQIRVPKIDESELAETTEQLPLANGNLVATVINVTGRLRAGGMGAAPFAGGGGQASGRGSPPPEKPTMTYEAPDSWKPGELVVERMGIAIKRDAVFEVKQDDERIEVTVTSLPSSRGMLLPNINRWRRQVGLPSFSETELEEAATELGIAGKQATYVTLAGDTETILGIIADYGGYSWFIKLQGDHGLVAKEQDRFEAFARSIKFE